MNKTIKKTSFAAAIFVLAVIILAATVVAVPQTAYAAPDVELPFTLTAPSNVVLTKENIGDSPTTLGMAYSMSNEINAFFVAYHDSGDESAYLASRGITAYDQIYLGIQIDWALDDVNDAVSGWHHNAFWDAAPLGTLGTDEDGKQQFSEWDVVDCGLYDTQIVNDIWLYRGMAAGLWNGSENWVGVKEQLRPSQYTYTEHDGDFEVRIDWTEHTMYSRVRFVVTTYNSETNETEHTFSDWSAVAAYGKDAEKVEPLKPGDVVAPTITGLRMTEEKFNDNPVVAFTLTVPETVAEQKARVAAANGTFRVEVEARIKGTTEWKDLHVAADLTAWRARCTATSPSRARFSPPAPRWRCGRGTIARSRDRTTSIRDTARSSASVRTTSSITKRPPSMGAAPFKATVPVPRVRTNAKFAIFVPSLWVCVFSFGLQ